MTIIKQLVDHWYNHEEEHKRIVDDVTQFVEASSSYANETYNQLIRALDKFRDLGEIKTCRK